MADKNKRRRVVVAALVAMVAGCSAEAVSPPNGRDDGDVTDNDGEILRDDAGEFIEEDRADAGDDSVRPEACVPVPEECNLIDDDCDTTVDDGFDLSSDNDNCGECGVSCSALPNADGNCTDGQCEITGCHAGWVDANNAPGDGCEYRCAASAEVESLGNGNCADGSDNDCDGRTDMDDPGCSPCVPEFCDGRDNNCDGRTDEDFDVDFDPLNCGRCGVVCPVRPNAVPICVLGGCDIRCQVGFEDRDGRASNGCEATCSPTAGGESACDGRDNDCDGFTDEEFVSTPCGTGLCVRNSVCHRGSEVCTPRSPPARTDTTCDNLDDDCDGRTDEDWVATGCVGACVDTATCIAGVAACGTPAAADNLCNNVDDDCDGAVDEEYAAYTCGRGICMRNSMCALGIERCVEGPSRTETCNALDDNCDGTTDNDPPAPAVLCSPAPRGTVQCLSGACRMASCDPGWLDADGSTANGCECEMESTEGRGEACSSAFNLDDLRGGPFVDNAGADFTVRGKIAPAGDEDWFRFTAVDSADTTCDAYHVDVRFTSNPGAVFRMDVYRGGCASTTCTNIADGYSYYTDHSSGSGTTAVGECQCRASNTDGFTICDDDGAVYYFRVYRAPGSPGDCAEYAIRVTNGVY